MTFANTAQNLLLGVLMLTACSGMRTPAGTRAVETAVSFPTPTLWQTPIQGNTEDLTLTMIASDCPPFAIDTTLPLPDEPQSYIGLHFDILPDGLESTFGFLLSGPGTDYLVIEVARIGVEVTQNHVEMLWLERVVCRDAGGHAYTEIRAVLSLPAMGEKERLITGTCNANGSAQGAITEPKLDPEIVAIGRFEDLHEPPVAITDAWRANPRTESFEVLSPDSVTCTGLLGE